MAHKVSETKARMPKNAKDGWTKAGHGTDEIEDARKYFFLNVDFDEDDVKEALSVIEDTAEEMLLALVERGKKSQYAGDNPDRVWKPAVKETVKKMLDSLCAFPNVQDSCHWESVYANGILPEPEGKETVSTKETGKSEEV